MNVRFDAIATYQLRWTPRFAPYKRREHAKQDFRLRALLAEHFESPGIHVPPVRRASVAFAHVGATRVTRCLGEVRQRACVDSGFGLQGKKLTSPAGRTGP